MTRIQEASSPFRTVKFSFHPTDFQLGPYTLNDTTSVDIFAKRISQLFEMKIWFCVCLEKCAKLKHSYFANFDETHYSISR